MSNTALIREALAAGEGLLRLAPCWVPRPLSVPGGRLRLDPRDLYVLGAHRGGIAERWLASTTHADNGPGTPADQGLSQVVADGKRVLLREAVEALGEELLGAEGGWNVLCTLTDNATQVPHHLHLREEDAARVGRKAKPESCYYPPHLNLCTGRFPYVFMGLNPGTSQADVRQCLERWDEGDNGILYLSHAHMLRPGTGWRIDVGVLHAPGSLVAYRPQAGSDVFAVFQSMVEGRPVSRDLLVKDVPPELHDDLDYLVSLLDWEANVDPDFVRNRLCIPKPVQAEDLMADCGYCERWVAYTSPHYSAKELTVLPGRAAFVRDAAAYGLIVIEGWGTVSRLEVEAPTLIRYGQMTKDELFVTAAAAREGVVIRNRSDRESLVMLKHFGPGNPSLPAAEA